jgi:trehalose 6-phosphate synthase/phosphatase
VERRQVDFVMCCGHFLGRDEDIFEYIERCSDASASREGPPAPFKSAAKSKGKGERDKNGKGKGEKANGGAGDGDAEDAGPTIVTTFGKHYTCTVGRKRSGAGYYVNDSDDIAELLANLTNNLDDGKGRVELLQFDTESSLGSSRSLAELARQNSTQSISRSASQHRLARNPSVSNVSNISDTSSL